MEDDYTKYILYAVIAVLYILFKVFRKKKPETTNDSPLPNSRPVEPSYSDRSTEDEEEPYASPTETDDKPSTFKGSMGELLKEFLEGPKREEFDPESFDREDELREEISDSEYQDEERETEEIEIIGTHVIPEFPFSVFFGFVLMTSTVLIITKFRIFR